MPPRKRTASAPKAESEEAAEPVIEDDGEVVAVEPQDSDDPGTDAPTGPAPDGETAPEPERSDIQTVDVPCTVCFSDGWGGPTVGARGCEHGTWQRKAAS